MAWEKYLVPLMEYKEMLMALAEKALSQELSYATSLCYHRICCKFASLEIEFRRFLGYFLLHPRLHRQIARHLHLQIRSRQSLNRYQNHLQQIKFHDFDGRPIILKY